MSRGSHDLASADGSIAGLDGPANEPSLNQNARERHDVPNNPQGGAMATDCHRPMTLTPSTAIEMSATGRTARASNECWADPPLPVLLLCAVARETPLPRSPTPT